MAKTVCFTGKRPNKLYGYDDKEGYECLFDMLYSVCKNLYLRHGVRQFITGGAQGVDQLAFWAVQQLAQKHKDIKNIVYISFEGQERVGQRAVYLDKPVIGKCCGVRLMFVLYRTILQVVPFL